ncbi:MAG: hypothetical protein K2Q18_17920 [Bdellovibrionales bacterium]|nr:hypothetical protein [Bdellovibrionales bacterium]
MKTFGLILILFSFDIQAKRVAPPVLKPLVKSGHQFHFEITSAGCPEVKSPCGMSVSLVSKNMDGKKVFWTTNLYVRMYDMQLETDVQDVHPTELKFLSKNIILVRDEKGSEYRVDATDGHLIKPLKTIIYSAKK